jgi:hypothetical protein
MSKMLCSITDGEQEPEMREPTEQELEARALRFDKIYSLLIAGAAINQRYRLNERLADMIELKVTHERLYDFLQDGLDVVGMHNDDALSEEEDLFIKRQAAIYAAKLLDM